MKRLMLLVILGLVFVPTASAAHRSSVHRLRREAHHFQALAAQKNRQLRAAQDEVAALQGQVTTLQEQFAQRTQELDAARKQADQLQAQLNAIPTPLEAAEQYLDRVVWAAEATDPKRPAGEIVSIAAMNYVADNHVNLFMRSYLLEHGGLPSLSTAGEILGAQAGLCGNAEIAFEALVRHFGYDVHRANFYYDDPPGTPDGHTAAEVYYNGAWHFFDPTFGLYWRGPDGNVLDINTVRTSGGIEHKNDDLLFNIIEDERDAGGSGVSDTWFETDPTTVVDVG